ncbi:MAG TPA: hypothetical protein GXX26_08055 [Clostridiaceae bacterium]|nr:hypothetical protein [Clostridiaceae bacterium]
MGKDERKLSVYIDRLNAEKKPPQFDASDNEELADLMDTVRLVRSLKRPEIPEEGYEKRLAENIASRLKAQKPVRIRKRKWQAGFAAIAAVMILALMLYVFIPFGNMNIVSAMEKAYGEVRAYHGILLIQEISQNGESFTQARVEVWRDKEGRYYVKQIEGYQSGLVTVNNGVFKWQLRPGERKAYLFSAFPDPYSYAFELGNEIDNVRNAIETKFLGKEIINGRETDILEVIPEGGSPYKLWIDKETRLPLQKQTAMQNALQYKVSYIEINFEDLIPEKILEYSLPEGYVEVDNDHEQIVNNMEEAFELAGFYPDIPEEIEGYNLVSISVDTAQKAVKLNYVSQDSTKRITLMEKMPEGEFVAASSAITGKIGGIDAEIQSPVSDGAGILGTGPYAGMTGMNSIRWQNENYEYAIVGNVSIDEIAEIVGCFKLGDVEIPKNGTDLFKPQVEVPVDMEVEENEQKSVDAGHSPWRLDHEFVAQVFASLMVSPEGIVGDYPITGDQLTTIYNTGTEAIVEISGEVTVVRRVYLKRLVRQDPTGIWTVVGYDPV